MITEYYVYIFSDVNNGFYDILAVLSKSFIARSSVYYKSCPKGHYS